MAAAREFHYRLRTPSGGYRPGSHRGPSLGAGQEYATHGRLLDAPDPRRIDIHASLRNSRREWLVRNYRQRSAVPVHAIVDVSNSMNFGVRSKLDVAAEFVEALGYSAFRSGDSAGLMAFDTQERPDLHVPARHSRGIGIAMSDQLLRHEKLRRNQPQSGMALLDTVARLAGKSGLVFVVSDFQWSLDSIPATLDVLAHSHVVPLVVWDPSETAPPLLDGLLSVRDAESGAQRSLWIGPRTRRSWTENVSRRRREIEAVFGARGVRPMFLAGAFDPEALTQYFLEELA